MHQVNIHEAKTHLSKLIQEVLAGEEVVIAKGNTPVARLTALPRQRQVRQLGTAKGKMVMADDFDKPLDDFAPYMTP